MRSSNSWKPNPVPAALLRQPLAEAGLARGLCADQGDALAALGGQDVSGLPAGAGGRTQGGTADGVANTVAVEQH